ncbi:MAG: HDOD domain-containing protein [Candidatus Moduliflexus flocculans]|nr:HDOD domain-containing protein [Candidatus Moduliflexus flocculans]
MNKPVPGYDLPQGGLWRHSIAAAVAADQLVQSLSLTQADEGFHGRPAARHRQDGPRGVRPRRSPEHRANGRQGDLLRGGGVHGPGNEPCGRSVRRILQGWSMPLELVRAVAWHHDPDQCEASLPAQRRGARGQRRRARHRLAASGGSDPSARSRSRYATASACA